MTLENRCSPAGVNGPVRDLVCLHSYRLCDPAQKHVHKSSPLFGQLHLVKKTGVLRVGDAVYEISR